MKRVDAVLPEIRANKCPHRNAAHNVEVRQIENARIMQGLKWVVEGYGKVTLSQLS